jgi:hypothetical protein
MARAEGVERPARDVWPITLTVMGIWVLLNRLLAELLVGLELGLARPVVGPLA